MDASQTKRKDEPPDRRLNHNLPRLRWNGRESMSFYKTFRMRSIDKKKNIKTTKKKHFFLFNYDLTVRGGAK